MVLPILNQSEVDPNLEEAKTKILNKLEDYMEESTGWRLKRCTMLDLSIAKYQTFRGRSYIPTPKCIPL